MNRSQIFQLIVLTFMLFVSPGCDHDTSTFDGPNLVDRFGDFAVIENLAVSKATVDFAAGESVFFTAQFNKNVEWVVMITGAESGAVKRIEGFDSELTAANATWNGGTTDLPFFKAERCTVSLLVPEEPAFSGSGEVEVLSPKAYEGTVFTDFETDAGGKIEVGNYEFEFTNKTGRSNTFEPAQGDYFYYLEGTDNVVPNFFVGLINISSSVTGQTYFQPPTTVPEDLYFNCFIHNDGRPHGIAVIQFVFDSNDSGAFEDGTDATFQIAGDFPLSWDGWRQISHPMSDLGMTQEQLAKIVTIRVLLISNKNAQPNPPLQVSFGIDFMTFTKGGPLEL